MNNHLHGLRPDTGPPTASDARRRLEEARVLVVGVGGLGSPVALQLAAAGVGTLILVDDDVVDVSNLNRQVLHRTSAIGAKKVESAARRLARRYPALHVETHAERLTPANIQRLFDTADFVVDATDGVANKFLINDGAVLLQRPLSHAGIIGFQGQAMTVIPGGGACLRCVFPESPPADAVPSCQEAGIMGAVAGIVGAVQAGEVVTYLTGRDASLRNRLLTFDARTWRWRALRLARDPACPLCGEQPSIADLAEHSGGTIRGVTP